MRMRADVPGHVACARAAAHLLEQPLVPEVHPHLPREVDADEAAEEVEEQQPQQLRREHRPVRVVVEGEGGAAGDLDLPEHQVREQRRREHAPPAAARAMHVPYT